MNTFWLKIAGAAIGLVLVICLISFLTSGTDSKPKEPQKTIYDQWEQDDKRLTAEPQFKEPPAAPSPVQPPQPVSPVQPPSQIAQAQQGVPTESPKPQFEQLSMEEEFEAQKLWIWVENQRKMGRLPVMGYGQMVKTCREIIQRWPQSKYAFFAKRALADLPERYHKMYNITKEEIDLGNLK